MPIRLPNPRRAKIHRSYTVKEIAALYGKHRNTVREWIKQGLPICDEQRPILILGHELVAFLTRKRKQNKRPCKPGEIYCVRCRAPQTPALNMAEYQPITPLGGNLIGLCPICGALIYRGVNPTKLSEIRGNLDITLPEAQWHITEKATPSVNSDLQ